MIASPQFTHLVKIPLPTHLQRPRPQFTGQSSPFNPNTNALSSSDSSGSSGSSSRAISIASNSSGSPAAVPPMTKKDAKIIFNNVADLALFSDLFTERLEDSFGSVLEGGTGHDCVGALFLEMVCAFQMYSQTPALICHMTDLDSPLGTPVQEVYHATSNGPRTPERPSENTGPQRVSRAYPDSRFFPHPCLGPPFSSHQTRPAASQILAAPHRHHRRYPG